MLIEDHDALKTWLTNTLEKLCEADPIALSKYVIALIKKEKPLEELKELMQEQMEVFLQSETKDFVMLLFNTLESKSYLKETSVKAVKQEVDDHAESGDGATKEVSTSKDETVEGKPDSTTAKSGEVVGSPSKDGAAYKPSKRSFEEDSRGGRGRRSPMGRRRDSPPRHRRSPIPSRRFRSRSRSPAGGYRRGGSPFSRRRRSSPFRRSRSRSYSPPARKFHSRGSTPTKDEDTPGYTPTARDDRKVRCRDYDEKGFCMKGDQCKFDHGNDALVLEDANSSGIVPYQPVGVPPPATIFSEPYVPVAAAVTLPPLHVPPPGYPPESVGLNRKRPFHELASEFNTYPPEKRFDYNRLSGRGRPMLRGLRGGRGRGRGGFRPEGTLSTQLAVRNIPSGINTIAHLNNHFARFGSLVNVQVHFEGDPASALVTFASPSEADLAMTSTEAVMGNRFIKVFYHNESKNASVPLKDRIGGKPTVNVDGNIIKTIVNEEAVQKTAAATQAAKEEQKVAEIVAIKKNQEVMEAKAKIKRASDEKFSETRDKMAALRKGKQELLDKLIEEQKKLLARLEEKKGTMKPEEKSQIMALIKSLTTSIEKAKDDLQQLVKATAKRRSVSDVQKELLDAELELFTAQQDGSDTVEIQKRVNHLRVESARMGVLPTSRSPRSRGGSPFYAPRGTPRFPRFRGRGRGRYMGGPGVTSVDRRPSKVLVSGYELEEKDALVEHFAKFGEIVDTLEDEITPSVIIHYKTRRFAEAAMSGGKNYGDRTLQLSWYVGSTPSDYHSELSHSEVGDQPEELEDDYTPLDPTYLPPGLEEEGGAEKPESSETSKGANESNDEFGADDLLTEDLLGEDDEEEDGERSWKR